MILVLDEYKKVYLNKLDSHIYQLKRSTRNQEFKYYRCAVKSCCGVLKTYQNHFQVVKLHSHNKETAVNELKLLKIQSKLKLVAREIASATPTYIFNKVVSEFPATIFPVDFKKKSLQCIRVHSRVDLFNWYI